MSVLLALKRLGLPMPAGAALLSAWVRLDDPAVTGSKFRCPPSPPRTRCNNMGHAIVCRCVRHGCPSASRLGAERAVGLYRAGDMHAVCARVRRRRAAGPRRSESGEPPLSTRAGRAHRYSCALRASDAHWYQSAGSESVLEGADRVLAPVGIRRTERPTAAAGRVRRWRAARRSADRARAMRGRCR